jgi:catechol 2,3-dioxygenase-like lactoylglutathione lyase family enzyme
MAMIGRRAPLLRKRPPQMLHRLLLALVAVLASLLAHATEPAVPHLKRVNFLVADLDRSLAIYRDVLGFRVFEVSRSGPDSYSYPVFGLPKEASLTFVTLDSATETRALAITEVRGVDLARPSSGVRSAAAVIRVGALREKLAALRQLELEVVEAVEAVNSEGLPFLEAAFVDPDGHLVVLYEFAG